MDNIQSYKLAHIFDGSYGKLVYGIKKEFLFAHPELRYTIHYEKNDLFKYSSISKPIDRVISHKTLEKEDRVLIVLDAPITSSDIQIICVELWWKTGYIFIYKRNGMFSDPYRPEIKVETVITGVTKSAISTATEEPREFAEPPPPPATTARSSMQAFTELLERLSGNTAAPQDPTLSELTNLELVKKDEPEIKNKEDGILYGVELSTAIYRKPSDQSIILSPFWCNHKHWVYYSKQFTISAPTIPASKITEMDLEDICKRNFFLNQNKVMLMSLPEKKLSFQPKPQMRPLFIEEMMTQEHLNHLVYECSKTATWALNTLIPEYDIVERLDKVDKGVYNVLFYEKKVKPGRKYDMNTYPLMFYTKYGLRFDHINSSKKFKHIAFCVKREIVGVEVTYYDELMNKEWTELLYGEMLPKVPIIQDFLENMERLHRQVVDGNITISAEMSLDIDNRIRRMLDDAVNDIPFHIYFTEDLERYIYHPFFPLPVMSPFAERFIDTDTDAETKRILRFVSEIRSKAENV
ncbi:ORF58 [Ostreid herpesvirus 1]|nr:ORF58 [Ostreid herpesvirus 1]